MTNRNSGFLHCSAAFDQRVGQLHWRPTGLFELAKLGLHGLLGLLKLGLIARRLGLVPSAKREVAAVKSAIMSVMSAPSFVTSCHSRQAMAGSPGIDRQ